MTGEFTAIFRRATAGHRIVADDWLPASRIRPFLLDDPGEVWLEFHGTRHGLRRDLTSPYSFLSFVAQKGQEFKTRWLQEAAQDTIQVCEQAYHVRYANKVRRTLELMLLENVPLIAEPALWWAPEQIYGVPDLLVHSTWLKGPFPEAYQELRAAEPSGSVPAGYVLFEIRFTTPVGQRLDAAAAQMRLNTYILGQLQGWMPGRSFLVTRDHLDSPLGIAIESQLDLPLEAELRDIRERYQLIRNRGQNLIPWSDREVRVAHGQASEPWRTAKDLIAWEKTPGGDPRVLPSVGDKQRDELAGMGFPSVDAMLRVEPSSIPLERVSNIGRVRARRIRAILQANRSGLPVVPAPGWAPAKKDLEFFVDFEYFTNLNASMRRDWPALRGPEMLFMIGVGWEEGDSWRYQVFVAQKEQGNDERHLLEEFIGFLQTAAGAAFNDADSMAVYHWNESAEPRQAKAAAERHNLPPDHSLRHLPWVDLRKVARAAPCAVPGAWSYSLKAVAKALGALDPAYDPQWVGDLDQGLDAMIIGWQAYADKGPKSQQMRILHQYLQADCKALWCVLSWMRASRPGAAFGAAEQSYVGWSRVKKGFSRLGEEEAFVSHNGGKDVFVYQQPVLGQEVGIIKEEHLVWGDWLQIRESQGDWHKIYSRGAVGWVHSDCIQKKRLLEVNFVDVGQGDGCFIVTPDNQYLLIDAGEKDHMYRFLRWRFRHFDRPIAFQAAIISHPDRDHYAGLARFFDPGDEAVKNVRFETIYHNGILHAPSKTGMVIVEDQASLQRALPSMSSRNRYANLLRAILDSRRAGDLRMLCAEPNRVTQLPGYGPGQNIEIQVLGPVPEGPPGERKLPWLGSTALTKNGHSVVLRLVFGKVALLLGGDLNTPAEEYLLGHYGADGTDWRKLSSGERAVAVERARMTLGVDIAKSCHHGSHDFSIEFLQALQALVTVVSSGDEESHSHPRPETLGALGRHGRGDRPLIYSTELARSAEEKIKHPFFLIQRLNQAREEDREIEFIEALITELGRSVAVYGMISLRTDGERVVISQKLEKRRPNGQKWDLAWLTPDEDGRLRYESEHGRS